MIRIRTALIAAASVCLMSATIQSVQAQTVNVTNEHKALCKTVLYWLRPSTEGSPIEVVSVTEKKTNDQFICSVVFKWKGAYSAAKYQSRLIVTIDATSINPGQTLKVDYVDDGLIPISQRRRDLLPKIVMEFLESGMR